jgi:predicted dehydrogenase
VEFYESMERAIREGSAPPVPLEAGIATLEVIEAARRSAAERAVIAL